MPIASFAPLNKCPKCDALFAVNAKPHCRNNESCSWVKCNCGYVIDREVGGHFNGHYVPDLPTVEIPDELAAEWRESKK